MRRRNMGNKVVKRAITWAMVLMLSFSAGLSSIATMTVYAVDNRVDDCEQRDSMTRKPQRILLQKLL